MKIYPILLLPIIAGCLSAAPKAPTSWTLDMSRSAPGAAASERLTTEAIRIASVDVCAPYGGQRLVVLRPDGSVAFDAFNSFAVSPALLLKGATFDAAVASGLFGNVVSSSSGANVRYSLEVNVATLALDCRTEGKRVASVALTVLVLDGRKIVANIRAKGTADVADDFSAAFSTAYAIAIRDAFGKLTLK